MKECWINVYQFSNGKVWYGSRYLNEIAATNGAKVAISNGNTLNYRIHVKLK